jgi:putative F0F1-ATPase subunit (Ca2+/Mg2+ transporter)
VTSRKSPDEERRYKAALRYSGMGIQFFVMIGIAAWGGQKLDAYFSTPKPFITIFLILLFSTGYFIKLYRDLTR